MSRELDRLRKRTENSLNKAHEALKERNTVDNHLYQVQQEYYRVTELSKNAVQIIDDLDRQFEEKTKLRGHDIVFLMLATALQCARQYIFENKNFRLTADEGDKLVENLLRSAPPSWQDILLQSVPYDALTKGVHISQGTELSGTTHRYKTLGHDPILGWIFGTANIMTNSLTKYNFESYQVKNMCIIRHYPLGTGGVLEDALTYAKHDPELLAAAVARQAIHFGSDYFTKQGLPIPLISTVNTDAAKSMIKCNIDMYSVTRGIGFSALINSMIYFIHKLFYDEQKDGSEAMYEVRTRKILSYSNAIAVSSNVVLTAFTKDLKKLDVGGMLVALYRFISDSKFVEEVKRDFLKNEIYNKIVGTSYDFMEE